MVALQYCQIAVLDWQLRSCDVGLATAIVRCWIGNCDRAVLNWQLRSCDVGLATAIVRCDPSHHICADAEDVPWSVTADRGRILRASPRRKPWAPACMEPWAQRPRPLQTGNIKRGRAEELQSRRQCLAGSMADCELIGAHGAPRTGFELIGARGAPREALEVRQLCCGQSSRCAGRSSRSRACATRSSSTSA